MGQYLLKPNVINRLGSFSCFFFLLSVSADVNLDLTRRNPAAEEDASTVVSVISYQ